MKTKPQVSDEEIRAFMDFEGLIAKHNSLEGHPVIPGKKVLLKILVAALGLSVIVFYFSGRQNTSGQLQRDIHQTTRDAAPPVTPADSLRVEVNPEDQAPAVDEQNTKRENQIRQHIPNAKPGTADSSVNEPRQEKKPVYFQAEPAEGYPSLYDYFGKQLVYPPAAVKDSIEGVVNVVFEIDTTGRPINIVVEHSPGALFDKEAIRLVENMPAWKPAYYNGKPVKSKISLPIDFSLTRILNPE